MPAPVTYPNEQLWFALRAVCARYDVGSTTLYRQIAAGTFPAPRHPVGGTASRWSRADLDAHDAKQQPGVTVPNWRKTKPAGNGKPRAKSKRDTVAA